MKITQIVLFISLVAISAAQAKEVGAVITLETGFQSQPKDASILTPIVKGLWRDPHSNLDVDFAIPSARLSVQDESHFIIGNPTVIAHKAYRQADLEVRYGGGIALPLNQVPEDDFEEAIKTVGTSASAMIAHADWNAWLWVPDNMSLIGDLEVDWKQNRLTLGADLTPFVALPVGNDEGDTEIFVQSQIRARFSFGMASIGADLRGLKALTSDKSDTLQLSVSPVIDVNAGKVTISGRAIMALDEPISEVEDLGVMYIGSVSVPF